MTPPERARAFVRGWRSRYFRRFSELSKEQLMELAWEKGYEARDRRKPPKDPVRLDTRER